MTERECVEDHSPVWMALCGRISFEGGEQAGGSRIIMEQS